MLNKIGSFLLVLIGLQTIIGQKMIKEGDTLQFVTYNTDELKKHELLFTKGYFGLKTFTETGLGGSGLTWHRTTTNSDTIIFHKNSKNDAIVSGGVQLDDPLLKLSFFDEFVEGSFLVISKNELLQLNADRPYFRKSYLDGLIKKEETIYAAKGKTFRAPTDFNEFSELEHLFEKPKRVKLKILNGKKGFEKYGVMGIKGVFEFYEKPKKCKTKN